MSFGSESANQKCLGNQSPNFQLSNICPKNQYYISKSSLSDDSEIKKKTKNGRPKQEYFEEHSVIPWNIQANAPIRRAP